MLLVMIAGIRTSDRDSDKGSRERPKRRRYLKEAKRHEGVSTAPTGEEANENSSSQNSSQDMKVLGIAFHLNARK